MGLKKRIQRFLKRLPVIGHLKKELAEQKRLNNNSERHIRWMMKQRKESAALVADLESRLKQSEAKTRELEADASFLIQKERSQHGEILHLNRHLSNMHEELRSAEENLASRDEQLSVLNAKMQEARKGFAIFEKFKQFAQEEYWALHQKHAELENRYDSLKALLGNNARAFCEDRDVLEKSLRSIERLKGKVRFALGAAKEYKYGANEYAIDMLAETLEKAGIGALIFDGERIIYATSYADETISANDSLVESDFANVFEEDSLESFSELGPQHPLTTKKGRQFAGILFSFMTGHDKYTKARKHYRAVWLIDDRKIGLSEYFKGNAVAMPRNITEEHAKRVVGSHLNSRIGRFGKSTKIAINCSDSCFLEPGAAEYLSRVASSDIDCEIEIRSPSRQVYDALIAAEFPENNIKGYSLKKKEKDLEIGSKIFGLGFAPV